MQHVYQAQLLLQAGREASTIIIQRLTNSRLYR
jgi:hypothetical protein